MNFGQITALSIVFLDFRFMTLEGYEELGISYFIEILRSAKFTFQPTMSSTDVENGL
jgi:hypothetical protein